MSFFGLKINADFPVPFRLDDGGVFNLKRVMLAPGQENTGKVYLMVNIPFEDEDYEDEQGKIDIKKFEEQIPIACLESGVCEQENLDLLFPWTQDLVFSVQGKEGSELYISGSMDSVDEDDGECDDENCEIDHSGQFSDSEEEFLKDGEYDSDEIMEFNGEDSESDDEPPKLIPINNKKKAIITEIPDEVVQQKPQQPKVKQEQPKKQPQQQQPTKPVTPDTSASSESNGKKKNKKNKNNSTEQPQQPNKKQEQPKPKVTSPKTSAKPQPQQPNKKRDLADKEQNNNTKKSKNNSK